VGWGAHAFQNGPGPVLGIIYPFHRIFSRTRFRWTFGICSAAAWVLGRNRSKRPDAKKHPVRSFGPQKEALLRKSGSRNRRVNGVSASACSSFPFLQFRCGDIPFRIVLILVGDRSRRTSPPQLKIRFDARTGPLLRSKFLTLRPGRSTQKTATSDPCGDHSGVLHGENSRSPECHRGPRPLCGRYL